MLKWTVLAAALPLVLPACTKVNPDFLNGAESGTGGIGSSTSGSRTSTTRADEAEGGSDAPPPDTGNTTSGEDGPIGTSIGSGATTSDTGSTSDSSGPGSGSTGERFFCEEPTTAGPFAYLFNAGTEEGDFNGQPGVTGIERARAACNEAKPDACAGAAAPMLVDPDTGGLDADGLPHAELEVVNEGEDCLMAESVPDLLSTGLLIPLSTAEIADESVWTGINQQAMVENCDDWDALEGFQAYLASATKAGLVFMSGGEPQNCDAQRPLICLCVPGG